MAQKMMRRLDPRLMKRVKDLEFANLKEFSMANGLPYTTLLPYFDLDETHKTVETLVNISNALDINIDEFVSLLLSKNGPKTAAQ